MDDQGEKIVFLARELLRSGFADETAPLPAPPQEPTQTTISMSFKTLCLTTILAAAGGGLAVAALHEPERPLTRYERTEIDALIFYAARLNGLNEDDLGRKVAAKVGVAQLADIGSTEFPLARKFLQEEAQKKNQ